MSPSLQRFLEDADRYAKAAGLERSSVSLYILNDGKGLDRLHDGGRISTEVLDRASAVLEERVGQLPADKLERYREAQARRAARASA